jgi:tRNA G46 methylase TrmB
MLSGASAALIISQGARVVEIGCGHGASTILLAKAYPQSQFVGFDYHAPSMRTFRLNSARLQQSKSARIHSEAVAPERALRVDQARLLL